ncbi:C4-dicarboxylate transporter/malic acid transporter [Colletotrichum graminicola]|uniref:C4-dicarboxylate transporter/malic acid transporter n=1 Tax=Colletotrichum graminicola (strain M1.001 / M2 / FGSC 10212) TaxID=645133 RepID=E3QXC5_COLGM|nr:C4-dicarboxylate transporter/malic acid transporter [Colletotrichum graminicola M1.001]EFQ35513.1 C4-dicarboxylate transporter/malic acid transporter [Colletotrichum graminicola M1.001]WDK08740.1 C4-dicarboxylate transporter/malic acid transporter [Colletotrichum graminicola]
MAPVDEEANNSKASTPSNGEGQILDEPSSPTGLVAALTRTRTRTNTILEKVSVRDRIRHFTFAWYTLTMSTGGIALLLGAAPHRFRGLDTIGIVVFVLDVVLIFLITAALCLRFSMFRKTPAMVITNPSEFLFIPTFFLSIAAALSNIQHYAVPKCGPWLIVTLRVCFWLYLVLTFFLSVGMYHLLFNGRRRLSLDNMTPAWILPIFPVMLSGTLAAFIATTQPPNQAAAMMVAGLAAQGLGFFISAFMYAIYLSRLMTIGLPIQRPGMFIAVGPPSFTAATLVAMGAQVPRLVAAADSFIPESLRSKAYLTDMESPETVALAVRAAALFAAVFLWGLSFWFFSSAFLATVIGMPDRSFHLSWWSFVFPNVGFAIATIRIGEALGSEGLLWFADVSTIILVAVWLVIGFCCTRAVLRKKLVWPGRDEDSH